MGRGRGRGGSRGGMNKSGMNDDEDFYDDDMGVSQLRSELMCLTEAPPCIFFFL